MFELLFVQRPTDVISVISGLWYDHCIYGKGSAQGNILVLMSTVYI